MDRREFFKKGTAAATLAASSRTLGADAPAYGPGEAGGSKTEIDVLPAYQSESSIVSEGELHAARQWLAALSPNNAPGSPTGNWLKEWLNTELPFSFRYGGSESSTLLARWTLDKGAIKNQPDGE